MNPTVKKNKMSKAKKKDALWGYFFIAPLTIGIVGLYIVPFIQNIVFSFSKVNAFNQSSLVGFDNYVDLMSDERFGKSVWNTFRYVIGVVPAQIILAIILAALLSQKIKGKSIYRTLYFIPAVTMPVAIAMVWKWIFNGTYGILNEFLSLFGIEGQNWVSNPKTAPYVIILVGIWMVVGYNMIILLAGIQSISSSYYEAASIDGASSFKQFQNITVPLLSPSIFFVMLTSLIGSLQVFDVIFMMIPDTSTAYPHVESMISVFYLEAFKYGNRGYASAISIVVFMIIMVITLIQMKAQKKWVHYT